MAFVDYAKDILRGGLPQVLDDPGKAGTDKKGDNRPEVKPPNPKITDTDPAFIDKLRKDPAQAAIMIGGAIVLIVLVAYLVKKV